MIINKRTLFRVLLLSFLTIDMSILAHSQDKLNVSLGIGIPELINVGVRYPVGQFQVGVNVGTLPSDHQNVMSYMLEGRYHFGGKSKHSETKPWFGRLGLNYHRFENKAVIDENYYLHLRTGKDINVSKKIGFEIDFGTFILLQNNHIIKQNSISWGVSVFDSPVLPSLGVAIFYRI